MKRFVMMGVLGLAVAAASHVSAAPLTAVDLELSLVVDSSGSISTNEFNLQKKGYENAFRNATVKSKIAAAPKGIAVNFIFFASRAHQVIPFTHLRTEADSEAFADSINTLKRLTGGTNIAGGIGLAEATLFGNKFDGAKQIIDVSADGVHNVGRVNLREKNLRLARDKAVRRGVDIINAITIGRSISKRYADRNIIAGQGAKTFVSTGFDTFENAVIEKIAFEIGQGTGPTPIPSPTAAVAGLAMLGVIVGRRRRRSA